jgi:hypothetical protein
MHYVEAAPLIYPQRSQPGVSGDPFHAELTPTTIQHRVHRTHFLAKQMFQLPPVHGGKAPGSWHGLVQRRHSPGERSKTEDHQLKRPLQAGACPIAGKSLV